MLHFILSYLISDTSEVDVRFHRVLHFHYLKNAELIWATLIKVTPICRHLNIFYTKLCQNSLNRPNQNQKQKDKNSQNFYSIPIVILKPFQRP